MNEDGYDAYVGLDVYKDTIATAVALPGRGRPARRILDGTLWRMRWRDLCIMPTHEYGQRKLQDGDRSGGTQPTDIRVTDRRRMILPHPGLNVRTATLCGMFL